MVEEIKLTDIAKKIGSKLKEKYNEQEKENILKELWRLRESTNNQVIKRIRYEGD